MCELTRRERKKEATRINILETAIELFEKQGFEQTTMNQISEKADVALGTLYNYFPSKEAIVGFYVNWITEQYRKDNWAEVMALDSTYKRLAYVLREMAVWHVENKRLAEIYLSDLRNYCFGPNWEPIQKNCLEEVIAEIFRKGQGLGDIRQDVDPIDLTRYLLGVIYAISLHWFAEPDKLSLEQKYSEGLAFFFPSCRPPAFENNGGAWKVLYDMFF